MHFKGQESRLWDFVQRNFLYSVLYKSCSLFSSPYFDSSLEEFPHASPSFLDSLDFHLSLKPSQRKAYLLGFEHIFSHGMFHVVSPPKDNAPCTEKTVYIHSSLQGLGSQSLQECLALCGLGSFIWTLRDLGNKGAQTLAEPPVGYCEGRTRLTG